MEQLSVNEKKNYSCALYELVGSVTFYTVDVFRPILYAKVLEQSVTLDLYMVSEIDSTGVALIFAALNDAKQAGHSLYILNPSEQVLRAFEETGLSDILSFINSTAEIA